jgi:endonuclease/exonuclease/phosphatase family metal-dependent hydrolase
MKQGQKMRLLSYNIHKAIGGRDRRYRIERIIEVIEHENPDLMCLQEVTRDARRSKLDNQPQLLADYFRSVGILYQMNVHWMRGGYGNLILSRWPFQSHHQISLRLNRRKPRGAQIVVVETPEGLLQLVNVHLGLGERERHWQVLHLLTHRLFREGHGLPVLISGDTNDWRDTLRTGSLAEHGFHHVTHPVSRYRSFPATLAMGALDKVFYRDAINVRHARIVRTKMARIASDHLPLVVDFHVGDAGSDKPTKA